MQIDEALYVQLQKEIKENGAGRVHSFQWKGEKVWLKQAEKVKNTTWINFARWACGTLGLRIFQPGNTTDGVKALHLEAGRLRRMNRLGLPVPRLIGAGPGWIVISDVGRPADRVLTDLALPHGYRLMVLRELARSLAQLHKEGFHHGRPALRDMAWNEEKKETAIFDFEDGILPGLRPDKRKQRDFLLFIQSIYKECEGDREEFAAEAMRIYREENPEGYRSAVEFFGGFDGVYGLFNVLLKHCGTDLDTTWRVLRSFRQERQRI